MDCPRCGTDMLTDCPLCHYTHRLSIRDMILTRFKRVPRRFLRSLWRLNIDAYLQFKPMLMIGTFMIAVMMAGVIIRTMPWLFMLPAFWTAGMVMYDIIKERKEGA